MRFGGPCICGKAPLGLSLVSDGICHWCGRGWPWVAASAGQTSRLRRLPQDLGAFQREGRRPDPHLENVVRLDRLREAWKVPPVPIDVVAEPAFTPRQEQVLALLAEGLTNGEIGARLGVSAPAISNRLREVYLELGVDGDGGGRFARARRAAVDWWREQQGQEAA